MFSMDGAQRSILRKGALASHRKRKERERAREPQTPKGLEVQAPSAAVLKALPAPGATS